VKKLVTQPARKTYCPIREYVVFVVASIPMKAWVQQIPKVLAKLLIGIRTGTVVNW
jgi:hypothetical protein